MEWIVYIAIFSVICIVVFVISRLWVSLVDIIIYIFKKLFRLDKPDSTKAWHTLDEIRKEKAIK